MMKSGFPLSGQCEKSTLSHANRRSIHTPTHIHTHGIISIHIVILNGDATFFWLICERMLIEKFKCIFFESKKSLWVV